ncbi:hypothetical protein VE04_05961 [Pseudogymnoascus sp. 24MN13]|nr:hypothetical protein VE04_05961 [Pseudogymnoascus sp. 24MN13]
MGEDTSTPPTIGKDNSSGSSGLRFSFKVTIDLQDELHAFVRYSRLGLFNKAEELYSKISPGNETCFAIIAERADSLLAQGRYRDLSSFLDDKIDHPEKYPFDEGQRSTLLLLKGVVDIHTNGNLRKALEVALSWRAAATSIKLHELSALETHGLRVYLHIISLAYANSTFVRPQYTQPPWTASIESQTPQNQLWSGFIDLCVCFSVNPVDFWDAQALFRLLLPVLPEEQVVYLFRVLNSKITWGDYRTEEELIAGLSITTAYVRHLLSRSDRSVYVRQLSAGNEKRYRVRELIQEAQRMLSRFERIVDVDGEFNDTKTRQFLELNLAIVEKETSLATDKEFYRMFESHDSVRNHIIWKIAYRNCDLEIQAAFLRIPYLGLRGTNLHRLSDGGLPKHLVDLMGDSMGYLNAMTDRILSVYKLSIMRNPPETPPTAGRRSGLLYSFDVPFIKFKGSFASWEPTATRSKTPKEILTGPREVVTKDQQTVNKVVSETPWPMHYASEKGYRAMVKSLLELNVDVNAMDINGRAPLVIVAKDGDVEIAKLLLDNNANAEARDNDLQTPLMISVENHDIDMATLLLSNNADAEARDGDNRTPMTKAVWDMNMGMVKLLLDNKADIEARGINGQTPLITAIWGNSVSMVKFLLDNKANINAKGAHRQTPLIAAVKNREIEIVTLLLQRKADASAKDINFRTPLILAVMNKDTDIVTALLGHPEAIPEDGKILLYTEARKAGGDIERLVKSALDSRAGLGQS